MEMKDRVALITGAAQGIGQATAEKMAGLGAKVAVLDINFKGAEDVVEGIRNNVGDAMAVQADLTVFDQVENAVDKVFEQFGTIDILVNNAGWTETHPFITEDEPYWNKVIDINLKGPIYTSKVAMKYMSEKKYGKILNVASDAARVGNAGEAVYSASKGGLITFTKSLAREVARYNVNVNCVCPGPTNTPLMKHQPERFVEALKKMIPFHRLSEPEELANVITFLCMDEARFVTGQVISVSGGLTMAG